MRRAGLLFVGFPHDYENLILQMHISDALVPLEGQLQRILLGNEGSPGRDPKADTI